MQSLSHFFSKQNSIELFIVGLGLLFLFIIEAMLYTQYTTQLTLKTYTPTTQAIKVSETVKKVHHYRKRKHHSSSSYNEFIPCITVKLPENTQPLEACKAKGFKNSEKSAELFLETYYGKPTGFTLYISPDKTKVSLEKYEQTSVDQLLWMMILTPIITLLGATGLYYLIKTLTQKA